MLGAYKPIHVRRREHDAFIDTDPPGVGGIEHLGLKGPHGMIPIRVCHPSKPAIDALPALIYMHGGFIVESLDQFDTAMRRLCEGAGVQVYAVDCRLAPEYHRPIQMEEGELVATRRCPQCRDGSDALTDKRDW